jgi:site-specific DNA recombinase
MKSIALYARVSSEQQAQQATVESQIAELKQRAESDGHVVLPQDIYVDEGFSGATLVRPALERLRDRAAEGAIELLYVHSPDRLARKYAYQVLLLDELRRHGVMAVFLHGPAGQTAEDELLVQVQGMIAEYERAKILERCRRGKIHRARHGSVNPMSGAPYGFAYIKKSDDAPASYRVLLHEAKVVRGIFHALVHEQKSIGEIVRNLNAQKIPTRRAAPRWDRATVWAILQNPAHMGKAAFGKTEATERRKLLRPIRNKAITPRRAKGAHRDKPREQWISIDVPAIVTRDVFDAAKEQLARNKQLSQRNARGERYLLQGLTTCSRCGYAFYGKTVSKSAAKGGERYAYYRCVGGDSYRFAGGRVCSNPQVRVDQLDGYVWQSVCDLLQNPSRMLDEWSRRQKSDGVPTELRERRDEALRDLAIHERGLKRLVDAYEIGAIELKELKVRSDAVRARIDNAKREVGNADRKLRETVHLRAVITQLEDFAVRVRKGLDTISWLERRHIIRTLVAKVEIDESGATIVYRLPSTEPTPGAEPSNGAGSTGEATSCQLREGRERCPLRRALHTLAPLSLFQHSRGQPLLHQPKDPPVRDAVLDKLHQPAVIDGIEEITDVRVEHPVHLLVEDSDRECVQRLVLATSGRKP